MNRSSIDDEEEEEEEEQQSHHHSFSNKRPRDEFEQRIESSPPLPPLPPSAIHEDAEERLKKPIKLQFNHAIKSAIDFSLTRARQASKFNSSGSNKNDFLKPLYKRIMESSTVLVGAAYEVAGDRVLRHLRQTIRLFLLTKQQLAFTEMFTQGLLPFIYGDDFDINEVRIKMENYISDLNQYVMICCPRRFGKTECSAIWTACVLMCVPKVRMAIFSPGKRQSSYFMDKVREKIKYLVEEHGFDWDPESGKDNKEVLGLNVDGTYRQVMGLPAKEETTRGTTADVVFCEEAASMGGSFFVHTVLPIASPTRSCCICISTIKGDTEEGEMNWFTNLLDALNDEGYPMFNIYKVYGACRPCMRAGIADRCTHNFHDLPFWQTGPKQLFMRNIMTKIGFADAALQELQGITKSSTNPAFPTGPACAIFNPQKNPKVKPEELTEDPRLIFVAMDPSGCGKSHAALMSTIYHCGTYVIVGGESVKANLPDDYVRVFVDHLRRIRSLPRLQRAKIVLGIENNTVDGMKMIIDGVKKANIPNLEVMGKDESLSVYDLYKGGKKGGVGLRTQGGGRGEGDLKKDYVQNLKKAIELKQIRFYSHFLRTEEGRDEEDDMVKNYMNQLKEQLKEYAVKIQVVDSEFQHPKFTYSGKHANGGVDDDAMVLMMAVHWLPIYIMRNEHRH